MSKNKPLVSIIIVNWNGEELLKDCFISLFESTYRNFEVIFVDNGSVDNSIETIQSGLSLTKRQLSKIHIVRNKKNLGFAEGNNVGYKYANGDLIFFLNNDTYIDKHCIAKLVSRLLTDPKLVAVQPKILMYPQKNTIDSVGSYFLSTGFLYHPGHHKRDNAKYEEESEVYTMKGAGMLFKKSILKKVGVFEKNYFSYFEETDLCHRVWLAGFTIRYIPTAKLFHKGGQTAKKIESPFLLYHSYKNRIYTYLKNFEIKNIMKVIPVHLFLCEVVCVAYLTKGQFNQARSVQKAILWNLFNIKMILKSREKTQKLRKISDDLFLPYITRKVRVDYYYHLFTTALAGYKD